MTVYEIPILLHGPLSDTPNFKVGQVHLVEKGVK